MNAEYLTIDNGSQCEEIENLTAGFPHRGVAVLCLTFFVKPIDLGDLPRLVISTDEGNSVREPAFVSLANISLTVA
jgi:hypothetical protein